MLAESLTPNHIFLSDLTLISINTSTNYILFAEEQWSTGGSYINDLLIYKFTYLPSLLAGFLTAWITYYHLKHQTGTKLLRNVPSTKLASYHSFCISLRNPNTSGFKQEITLSSPLHTLKDLHCWEQSKFSTLRILQACINQAVGPTDKLQLTGQSTYPVEAECPPLPTDNGKSRMARWCLYFWANNSCLTMKVSRRWATASFIAWYVLLPTSHSLSVPGTQRSKTFTNKVYRTASSFSLSQVPDYL